ncbi:MAG: hypothetical protein HOI23_12390 [Deltaproteobacteria bacterium]|nr:hypothetical protein [Deltaproteobacteria bacterium]
MFMKNLQIATTLSCLAAVATLGTIACSDGATLEDGTEETGGEADTESTDPVDEPGPTIIQPTKEFPGALTQWCTGQPEEFSFFVTSMDAIWKISDSVPDDWDGGFGGDFQGLEGADSICQIIGIATGHGHKRWRALLSATDDGAGNPVHAIDRIGQGPWHDANGRLIANNLDGLMGARPAGDEQTVSDLPDECGVPLSAIGDSHDIPTGSDTEGRLRSTNPESTCNDWTTSDGTVGESASGGGPGQAASPTDVYCGHSFPRQAGGGGGGGGELRGQEWLSDHKLRGCGKGANLEQNGGGVGNCIGCSGGYGALYCFVEAQN